ncbi:MAG TPA: peptidoglycan glycosyltransferase [Candidatus Pullilachnospira gallistercoris]|uniref:Peptidoglycan glycosyltransferase n=1 Tax=Candidatus Pullilachnospira gallistercoris TaxID=2840911 RepID=A0A9D1JAM3_9FIRM|nr:peptidoglycan glycosyltransferase [Candidatus Pullilachnospira gallistercoris]
MKKKITLIGALFFLVFLVLMGRLVYLMVFQSQYYSQKAEDIEERERDIKAARGRLIDANGKILATNETVCTVSVIHSQITDADAVTDMLVKELGLTEEEARKRVEKVSSIERAKTNVPKETGDAIRAYDLDGVKVDEDYRRYYPYDELASKVLGFTGGDNQGIVGLESRYESYLKGTNGKILTLTDSRGVELKDAGESRLEPINGSDLYLTLDYNIQSYAQQLAEKAMEECQASAVELLVMNPQNGEIMAMVNVPEFNLNEPFTLADGTETSDMERLNEMWRNACVSDTYEPGSTFKIITTAAALEEHLVTLDEQFNCSGAIMVEDTRIRCHKTTGHGPETFVDAIKNSCNPVFIQLGLRIGVERYFSYFRQFGLAKKTGIDLPGEANTIMHAEENVGPVELATISFGQSFQISAVQLATTVSSLINGGVRVTPHVAREVRDSQGELIEQFTYEGERIVSEETSETLRYLLNQVVSSGTGRNGAVEGYAIGGKTATSQTLPRSNGRYIASFIGFAPAQDPQVLALVIIHDPQGIYYGGTIAAPVVRELFENILPYLGIEKSEDLPEPSLQNP